MPARAEAVAEGRTRLHWCRNPVLWLASALALLALAGVAAMIALAAAHDDPPLPGVVPQVLGVPLGS